MKVLFFTIDRRLSAGNKPRAKRRGGFAFTLIELLAVLGIIAIITAVAAPAVLGVINSTRLTQAGDELAGLISQAQQTALSESRPVEVRLYNLRDTQEVGEAAQPRYRGVMLVKYYQIGEADPRSSSAAPLSSPLAVAEFGGIHRFPGGIEIARSPTLTSFMNLREIRSGGGGGSAEIVVKRNGGYEPFTFPDADGYRAFLCLPEGTDLNIDERWFVTLVQGNDRDKQPSELKNFYTVQIEPVTGRLMTYRP